MGWGEKSAPTVEVQLERVLTAYDALWHRARKFATALTLNLPTPHELRTGETPADVMDRLRRGEELHEQGGVPT